MISDKGVSQLLSAILWDTWAALPDLTAAVTTGTIGIVIRTTEIAIATIATTPATIDRKATEDLPIRDQEFWELCLGIGQSQNCHQILCKFQVWCAL